VKKIHCRQLRAVVLPKKTILLFPKKLFFKKINLSLDLSPGGTVAVFTATLVCHHRRTRKKRGEGSLIAIDLCRQANFVLPYWLHK